jgi:hypothetical protein
MIEPFAFAWNEHPGRYRSSPTGLENDLLLLHEKVRLTLGVATQEFGAQSVPSNLFQSSLFWATMTPDSRLIDPSQRCLFCNAHACEVIDNLQQNGQICTEFMARESRMSRVDRIRCSGNHREHINKEGQRLTDLSSLIASNAASFEELEPFVKATLTPDSTAARLLMPASLGSWLFINGFHKTNCLDQTTAQQWLDAMIGHPVQADEDFFASYVATAREKGLLDVQGALGRTLLHIACQKKWTAGARLLLAAGAKRSVTTEYGSLPMHYAAANGCLEMCELLLCWGAKDDLDVRDHAGFVACDYALRRSFHHITALLIHQRSNPGPSPHSYWVVIDANTRHTTTVSFAPSTTEHIPCTIPQKKIVQHNTRHSSAGGPEPRSQSFERVHPQALDAELGLANAQWRPRSSVGNSPLHSSINETVRPEQRIPVATYHDIPGMNAHASGSNNSHLDWSSSLGPYPSKNVDVQALRALPPLVNDSVRPAYASHGVRDDEAAHAMTNDFAAWLFGDTVLPSNTALPTTKESSLGDIQNHPHEIGRDISTPGKLRSAHPSPMRANQHLFVNYNNSSSLFTETYIVK